MYCYCNCGVRGGLVVKFAAARMPNPSQIRNLNQHFCPMRTAAPPLAPQHLVPEPVPSLETHLKSK